MTPLDSLPRQLRKNPVSARTLPTGTREQLRRERVVEAAIEVFAKRGYIGTTVDHVVAAAGIGVGSFYELFGGREDCFLQVYEAIVREIEERLRLALEPMEDPPAKVCVGLQVLLEALRTDRRRGRIALIEVQTAGPEALARHQKNLDAAVPLLLQCRTRSPYRDQLPSTLEHGITGGVAWLAHQRLAMAEKSSLDDLYPELVDIVLGPYYGEQEAARIAAENRR
jgi:AcrR family transcriptional regulator